jgi:hypothetical protein
MATTGADLLFLRRMNAGGLAEGSDEGERL